MDLSDILLEERSIWGYDRMSLVEISTDLIVITGDIARQARHLLEGDRVVDKAEVQAELGNLITSSVRWLDDLELSTANALHMAFERQKKYVRGS
jgi:hypothetical protein